MGTYNGATGHSTQCTGATGTCSQSTDANGRLGMLSGHEQTGWIFIPAIRANTSDGAGCRTTCITRGSGGEAERAEGQRWRAHCTKSSQVGNLIAGSSIAVVPDGSELVYRRRSSATYSTADASRAVCMSDSCSQPFRTADCQS